MISEITSVGICILVVLVDIGSGMAGSNSTEKNWRRLQVTRFIMKSGAGSKATQVVLIVTRSCDRACRLSIVQAGLLIFIFVLAHVIYHHIKCPMQYVPFSRCYNYELTFIVPYNQNRNGYID